MNLKISEAILLYAVVPSIVAFAAALIAAGAKAILIIPVIFAVSLAVASYSDLTARRKEKEADLKELSSTVGLLGSRMRDAKTSLFSGILDAAGKAGGTTKVSALLLKLRKRMLFGQDLETAIYSEDEGGSWIAGILKPIGREYSKTGSIADPLKTAHNRLSRDSKVKMERAIGSNQRYLVISMVFSTILPSLAIFAFVGYSILSYSDTLFLLFSAVLLSVLPGASVVIRLRLDENY